MTLHHRDVQQNCSLESDIKRNQCPLALIAVNLDTQEIVRWTSYRATALSLNVC